MVCLRLLNADIITTHLKKLPDFLFSLGFQYIFLIVSSFIDKIKIMKCNYKIYEETSGEMPETDDPQIAEQILLAQVKQAYERPQRIVVRPEILVWKDVLLLVLTLSAIAAALIAVRVFTDISALLFVVVSVLCGVVYLAVFSKKLLITVINIYQKYAPEFVRSSCLYEPCCSEYMKIAVNKYGVRKGFIKGIKRISRCRYPNGGVDEP